MNFPKPRGTARKAVTQTTDTLPEEKDDSLVYFPNTTLCPFPFSGSKAVNLITGTTKPIPNTDNIFSLLPFFLSLQGDLPQNSSPSASHTSVQLLIQDCGQSRQPSPQKLASGFCIESCCPYSPYELKSKKERHTLFFPSSFQSYLFALQIRWEYRLFKYRKS